MEQWLTLVIGGPAIIGAALSWLLEYAPYVGPWFARLSFKRKRAFLFMVSLGIAILAALGLAYGYQHVLDGDLLFKALSAGFAAFTASQAGHTIVRKDKEGSHVPE